MPIKVTRTLLSAALDGSLKNASFRTDPYFGLRCDFGAGRRAAPALSVQDLARQDRLRPDRAQSWLGCFRDNFVRFEGQVDADVRPPRRKVRIAAGVERVK